MKDNSLRINIEFIINAIIAAGILLSAASMTVYQLLDFGELFSEAIPFFDGSPESVIFSPIIIIVLIGRLMSTAAFIFYPFYIGIVCASLTFLARFKYTINGSFLKKGYTTLTRTVYIIDGLVLGGTAVLAFTAIAFRIA